MYYCCRVNLRPTRAIRAQAFGALLSVAWLLARTLHGQRRRRKRSHAQLERHRLGLCVDLRAPTALSAATAEATPTPTQTPTPITIATTATTHLLLAHCSSSLAPMRTPTTTPMRHICLLRLVGAETVARCLVALSLAPQLSPSRQLSLSLSLCSSLSLALPLPLFVPASTCKCDVRPLQRNVDGRPYRAPSGNASRGAKCCAQHSAHSSTECNANSRPE